MKTPEEMRKLSDDIDLGPEGTEAATRDIIAWAVAHGWSIAAEMAERIDHVGEAIPAHAHVLATWLGPMLARLDEIQSTETALAKSLDAIRSRKDEARIGIGRILKEQGERADKITKSLDEIIRRLPDPDPPQCPSSPTGQHVFPKGIHVGGFGACAHCGCAAVKTGPADPPRTFLEMLLRQSPEEQDTILGRERADYLRSKRELPPMIEPKGGSAISLDPPLKGEDRDPAPMDHREDAIQPPPKKILDGMRGMVSQAHLPDIDVPPEQPESADIALPYLSPVMPPAGKKPLINVKICSVCATNPAVLGFDVCFICHPRPRKPAPPREHAEEVFGRGGVPEKKLSPAMEHLTEHALKAALQSDKMQKTIAELKGKPPITSKEEAQAAGMDVILGALAKGGFVEAKLASEPEKPKSPTMEGLGEHTPKGEDADTPYGVAFRVSTPIDSATPMVCSAASGSYVPDATKAGLPHAVIPGESPCRCSVIAERIFPRPNPPLPPGSTVAKVCRGPQHEDDPKPGEPDVGLARLRLGFALKAAKAISASLRSANDPETPYADRMTRNIAEALRVLQPKEKP